MVRASIRLALLGAVSLLPLRSAWCTHAVTEAGSASSVASGEAVASPAPREAPPPRADPPVRVEEVAVPDDLTAFVVRGAGDGPLTMVFVPGMCVHPGGYVQSFQHTAAAHGTLVAVQGDVSCGGDGSARRWSGDLEAMKLRIDAAFVASGLEPPRGAVVIGYSQGAERAERLAARWPDQYRAAVLIASPIVPSAASLARKDAVVLMAGTYDMSRGPMRGAVGPIDRAGVPVIFLEIPGARHGQMGDDPEGTMSQALDFVEQNIKVKTSPPPPSHGNPPER